MPKPVRSGLITRWPGGTGTRRESSSPQETSPPAEANTDWRTETGPLHLDSEERPPRWRLAASIRARWKTPAQVIQKRLDLLRWNQRVLARKTGYTEKHVSFVLAGKAAVTTEFAVRYWRATGGSPRELMRAQADLDLRRALDARH